MLLNIVRAYKHIKVVTKCLQDVRRDLDKFSGEYFKQACKLAEEVSVEPLFPRAVGCMN